MYPKNVQLHFPRHYSRCDRVGILDDDLGARIKRNIDYRTLNGCSRAYFKNVSFTFHRLCPCWSKTNLGFTVTLDTQLDMPERCVAQCSFIRGERNSAPPLRIGRQLMTQALKEFRAKQQRMNVTGPFGRSLEVAYTDEGSGDAVVLLHGIPTWSFLYHRVIPILTQQHRVIAPDLLGYGYSDHRDFFDRSVRTQARMITELLDALNIDKATIVGHDIGGAVALILALDEPHRVERLVLTNSVAYDSWPSSAMCVLGDPFAWRDKTASEFAEWVAVDLAVGLPGGHRDPAWELDIVAPYSTDEGARSLIRNAISLNTNHTMELVPRHGEIQIPTLLLWGESDPWQPASDGLRLAREIEGASFVGIPGVSHWIQEEAPEQFAKEILSFLENASPGL